MDILKRVLFVTALLAAFGGLGLALVDRGPGAASTPGAPLTQALSPSSGGLAASPPLSGAPGPFLGVVLARGAVDVAARSEGRVAKVLVRLGDRVKKDQVLGTLETRAARGDLAMADAGFLAAQAEVDRTSLEVAEARDRLVRIEPLSEGTPAVSGDELSRARYQEKIAQARLAATRASLNERRARTAQARTALHEAAIRAPFAGTITGRYADPGAIVGRGVPILRLISSDDLIVRFAVPDAQAGEVAGGLRVQAAVGDGEGTQPPVRGVIEKIAPEVDAASRMVVVEARLDVPAAIRGQVLAGRVARVTVLR